MECALKHLENASDTEREVMVSKLYNMQWLKKTSSTCQKTKTVYKQMKDDNENDIARDKNLSTENIVTSLVEESVADCSTDTHIHEKQLSSDTVQENNANILIKDVNAVNLFPNINELVAEKGEENEILSIVESIVTAKVEAQFDVDKEQKDQSIVSQSNTENITRIDDCSNLSNSQKIDQDTKEQKSTKNFDDNHSTSAATPIVPEVNNEEKSICIITDAKACKTSTEIKDKDVSMKKVINEQKTNFKNGCNTRMDVVGSRSSEKSSASNSDSKKPISNSSRSSRFSGKNERLDRFNNKTGFTKNIAYIKRQEFVKQHNVSKSGTDKETKEVKSSVAKTDLKVESNKIPETCHSKNTNKDKILQKQQNVSKQFVSKLKREERRSICLLNQSISKNEQLEKLEKVTNASKNFDVFLNESEKKCGKTVERKFEDKRINCDVNLKRLPTTFVTQYKNSTFSKSMQVKNIPKNTEQSLTDGKNTYPRNNFETQKFNKKHTDNAERKAIMKKEYINLSTNKRSNLNVKNKEICANNLENGSKSHEDVNRTQSTNIKPSNTNNIDTLPNKNINSMKAEINLIKDKKDANSSIEHNTCAGLETMGQCHEEGKEAKETKETKETNTIDKSKIDIYQQLTDMSDKIDNDKINPSKYSNLDFDTSIVESQPNMLYQHVVKSESIQCMDDTNQLKNNQTIWYNNSFDNSLYKNTMIMNSQQSIQNVPLNAQQTEVTQAENQMRQISQWRSDSNKFYDQHCPTSDMMHFLQIPNTLDVVSSCGHKYECNMQTPPACENTTLLEAAMNGENPNVLYKCTPTVQSRSAATHSHFSNHPLSSDQISSCRWSPSIQDGFYAEHPYNITQLTAMNGYNPEVFSPDNCNNLHITNCPQSAVIYASPPYMQTWDPQLQYSTSGYFYNSPCANYAILSDTPSEPNNLTDIYSIHEQQQKYVPYIQMSEYAKDAHPNNCARQTRNFANTPLKCNQYYKYKNPDNYRTAYNVPQYITRSRQQSMNFTTEINQSNPYCSPNQKYHKQNSMQMSRNMKSQTIKISSSQDLICDDNGPEVIPPMISPKEFITSKANYSNKFNRSATCVFKPEFKARPNTSYQPLKLPKYSSDFQRNITCQGFSKEYTPSIGRGTHKFKKA